MFGSASDELAWLERLDGGHSWLEALPRLLRETAERWHLRLDRLTAELGLDRERARLWSLAQTVAWSLDSDSIAQDAETARWLLDA